MSHPFPDVVILFSKAVTSRVNSSMSRDFILGMNDKPFDSIDISFGVKL